jgi:hypothetical protein
MNEEEEGTSGERNRQLSRMHQQRDETLAMLQQRTAELEEVRGQRDELTRIIRGMAIRVGICEPGTALTGEQLIELCGKMLVIMLDQDFPHRTIASLIFSKVLEIAKYVAVEWIPPEDPSIAHLALDDLIIRIKLRIAALKARADE